MRNAKTLQIADLLGSKIITSEGKIIGHVVDIELTRGSRHEVKALVYGAHGRLYRWHVLWPFAEKFGPRFGSSRVPWDAVERFGERTVTLKPGWEPKRK